MEKNIYFQKRYKIENRELKNIANSFVHNCYGQFLYTNKINKRDFLLSASLPYELTDGDKKLLRYDRYDNIAEINYEIENNYVEFSGLNRDHVFNIYLNLNFFQTPYLQLIYHRSYCHISLYLQLNSMINTYNKNDTFKELITLHDINVDLILFWRF